MKILGLHKDPWHNSGAAVIIEKEGKVEFGNLSEERANREKDSRAFPEMSTKILMEQFGINSIEEFDYVVMDYIINKDDWKKDHFRTKCTQNNFLDDVPKEKLKIINHHLCHAYSTFYSSPYEKAAIKIKGSVFSTKCLNS